MNDKKIAQIWIDADACPVVIKEILFKAADRTRTQITLVANHALHLPPSSYLNLGHDNLSMFKNLLKYRHESKKQVCNSFTYFRGQI